MPSWSPIWEEKTNICHPFFQWLYCNIYLFFCQWELSAYFSQGHEWIQGIYSALYMAMFLFSKILWQSSIDTSNKTLIWIKALAFRRRTVLNKECSVTCLRLLYFFSQNKMRYRTSKQYAVMITIHCFYTVF